MKVTLQKYKRKRKYNNIKYKEKPMTKKRTGSNRNKNTYENTKKKGK